MIYTGLILFIFLVLHIRYLKFGTVYHITYDGETIRDLYKTVIEYYRNPINVGWYVFAMACLSIHLSHGFWSVFQTFGFSHPKYIGLVRKLGLFLTFIFGIGFSIIPLYCYFFIK